MIYAFISRLKSRVYTLVITYFYKNIVLGKKTYVYHKSKILNCSGGQINIGKNCMIGRSDKHYHAGMPFYTSILNDGVNSQVIIGSNCRINGAYIHAKKLIKIGDNCVIATGVIIIDTNGHQVKSYDRTVGSDNPDSIIIGNNVWIGLNAIILKGTEIGDNSIISAGTVVKGTIPPNTVVERIPYTLSKIGGL